MCTDAKQTEKQLNPPSTINTHIARAQKGSDFCIKNCKILATLLPKNKTHIIYAKIEDKETKPIG